ncbi:MAG: divalent-cation tolerance protein CutA [Bacteroidetes bacterium]|nr:divalent-cation tolerance protein CutA [Bacteroidota bacterium]
MSISKQPVIFVYITAADSREARKIGYELVQSRLAACINIFPQMKSIYRWQGKIEQSNEVVMIAKTKKALFKKVEKKVLSMHSYSCPCIIKIPVSGGNKKYMKWLLGETR